MTALQLILGIPFLALWIYVVLNVFETFKLMLYKGEISEEIIKRRKKRIKVIGIMFVIYIVFAVIAFYTNHMITSEK